MALSSQGAGSGSVVGTTTSRQVVFVGPMGVGKTTAVRALSDVPVVGTEVLRSALAMSSHDENEKLTTTVGIDYGECAAPDGGRVALVGTPGQGRFESARSSALGRRSTVVLWMFGDRTGSVDDALEWLQRIGGAPVWERTVVAVTRRTGTTPGPAEYRSAIRERLGVDVPVLEADPRERDQVALAVSASLQRGEGPAQ